MRSRRSLLSRTFSVAAGGLLLAVVIPTTSDAVLAEPTLEGEVSCNADTGHLEVLWTLQNDSGSSLTVDSAVTDDSGQTSGSALTADVTMTPNPLPNGEDATGVSEYTGDSTGDTHLVLNYTFEFEDPQIDAEVVLPGGCVASVSPTVASTTTTEPTTTAVAAAAAPAVQAQPAFTG